MINGSLLITDDILKIQRLLNDIKNISANPSSCNWYDIKALADEIENKAYHLSTVANRCINDQEELESAHADHT